MRKLLDILFAAIGWFAVTSQFILMIENKATPIMEMTIRFFSFFTILSNILVSGYFTHQVFEKKKRSKSLFNQPGSLTAITVYITVVGMVYQIALRHVWQPTGLQMIVDELLHTLIPTLVIIYWALYEQKSRLEWKKIPRFLLYPLFYLAFILLRGQFSDFYPYPFINVIELGWVKTLMNIMVLLGVFVFLSLLFIGIGRLMVKKNV